MQILMSTYNGEKYLQEQIDSLLAQTYPNIEILIRDDGSKDATRKILQEYKEKNSCITVYEEENVGVTKSFFKLLMYSDAEYIAFCDQDDIWLDNKIEKAIEKLKIVEEPALYCSNKVLVDAEGKIIVDNNFRKLEPGFANAVVESICTGCTAVMNRKLADEIKRHIPENAMIHDWWCYLVASYVGKVIFDENSYIWYRQHGNNVIGKSTTFLGEVKAKAKHLKTSRGKLKRQLQEFQQCYQGIEEKDRLVANILKSEKIPDKFKIVFGKGFYRQNKLDGLIARILFLFNLML